MIGIDAVLKQNIEQKMRALVRASNDDNRIILFPPGTLPFLLYVLTMIIGSVCLAFLYSGIFFPLTDTAKEVSLTTLLVPMGIAVLLVVTACVFILAVILGRLKLVNRLSWYTLALLLLSIIGTIAVYVGLWLAPPEFGLVACACLVFAFLLITSRPIFMFAAFFSARADLKREAAAPRSG